MSVMEGVPAEVLRRVRRLEITAGRLVNEVFAGAYSSTFKGHGMEFAEVREYVPGDDVRSIDWNVTARMGHPFIKRFVEERELTVLFVVDASASLGFGSRGQRKNELAAEITAVLSLAALRNNDKAGMLFVTDEVERYIPPRKTRAHMLRLIREALTFRPRGRGTQLSKGLDYLNRVLHRRAVVFILSDFLGEDLERSLRLTARRHDALALPLSDAWEEHPPQGMWLALEDAETGERRYVKNPRGLYGTRREAMKRLFQRAHIDSVSVRTGEPYVQSFQRFFHERARRLR